ncbi:reverse transcriptase [Tanacetum coccineum]
MNWGEVNPVHAYYNGSCTSKDTEDPSWSTCFKTRRIRKTSSALEALWKNLFVLYLYLIGTFEILLLTLTVNEIGTRKPKEPKKTLEDKFKDLHLNLLVLEVLAHAPIYNAILDKYVESLELGKNRSTFIQGEMPKKIKDPGLFTLPCILENSNPFDTLANLGSCVNLIPLYLFKKLKIRLLEEINHVFGLADGTKSYPIGIVRNVEVHIGKLKLLEDFYVIDMEKDPATPLLVGRGFLATASAVIDCDEEVPYTLGKRESYTPRPIKDGIGAQPPYYAKKDFMDYHFPGEWEIARDVELNPFKDVLVFRNMVEFLGAIPINLKKYVGVRGVDRGENRLE